MKKHLTFLIALLSCLGSTAANAEIVTNPPRSDGFGAQFQTIIYAAIYAELTNNQFAYTPFTAMEHNYEGDEEFLSQKEDLIGFIGNFPINTDSGIQAKAKPRNYIHFFESNIEKCINSQALKNIKKIFRENKLHVINAGVSKITGNLSVELFLFFFQVFSISSKRMIQPFLDIPAFYCRQGSIN